MTLATAPLRADLAALMDPAPVVVDAAACAALSVDGKIPECAVAPTTAEQVAAVLRYAGEHNLAVIARGSGTKLSTGNPPRRYDVALSLRELHRVIHYESADLTISVEAGMTFGEFQDLAGRNGLWLPIDPRGAGESTMGGIIAANAAGPLRQGQGGPRDMVLGLKIATTDGKIVKTGGRVVKNVAGYDLGKLLTGSFGTLGVIVEACLKLFPKPPERATFAIHASSSAVARDLRKRILRSPLDPMRLVLLSPIATALLADSTPTHGGQDADLWIEVGGSHRVIERCMHELRQIASAVGASLARVEGADELWGKICDLARWLQPKCQELTVLKAALPIAAGEQFVSHTQQEADSERVELAIFAQLGTGIVHLCLLPDLSAQSVVGLVGRLRQSAADLGGTLVIEHSPLDVKSQLDVWGATGDDVDAMRKLKSLWDPRSVLSPGRFVGGI